MTLSTNKNGYGRSPRSDVSTDRPVRSLAKAASWRVTGSLDTIFLSWLFTGDLTIAAAIGLTEVVTKMVLFYAHERIWNRIPLGRGIGAGPMTADAGKPVAGACIERA